MREGKPIVLENCDRQVRLTWATNLWITTILGICLTSNTSISSCDGPDC